MSSETNNTTLAYSSEETTSMSAAQMLSQHGGWSKLSFYNL